MQLTGIILFFGAIILFLLWSRSLYFILKYKSLLKNTRDELLFEYTKGIAIFIAIAISAGMAWG